MTSDASFRRYFRLDGGPSPALVMDAPPQTNAPITAFLEVAQALRAQGLSAPAIHHNHIAQGLAVIEDLGDALYARVVLDNPGLETDLYAVATDVLVHLHNAPCPDLPVYGARLMGEMAALSLVWYAPDPQAAKALETEVRSLCETLDPTAFTQRDYHAENLLWLPDRSGLARVGLLDFQDAMRAPAAYDLVSLLSDARRDVSTDIGQMARDRYVAARGLDPHAFAFEYDLCGAQRSLRILGVFARLWLRDGKPGYLPLIPRVWGQLQKHLAHPELSGLKALVDMHLLTPTPAVLAAIKARR